MIKFFHPYNIWYVNSKLISPKQFQKHFACKLIAFVNSYWDIHGIFIVFISNKPFKTFYYSTLEFSKTWPVTLQSFCYTKLWTLFKIKKNSDFSLLVIVYWNQNIPSFPKTEFNINFGWEPVSILRGLPL